MILRMQDAITCVSAASLCDDFPVEASACSSRARLRRRECRAGAWPWPSLSPSPSVAPSSEPGVQSPRPKRQRLSLAKLLQRSPAETEGAGEGSMVNDADGRVWLPAAPAVPRPRAVHNAASLAYLGDAIYELYVRRHFLTPPQSIEMYNTRVQALACCEAQDALLRRLVKDRFLSDEEEDVLRWGRNVKMGHKRATKRAGTVVYNSASSLETLIGYLYLTNSDRLDQMMCKLGLHGDGALVDVGPEPPS